MGGLRGCWCRVGVVSVCCGSEVQKSLPKREKKWDKNTLQSFKLPLGCPHPTGVSLPCCGSEVQKLIPKREKNLG